MRTDLFQHGALEAEDHQQVGAASQRDQKNQSMNRLHIRYRQTDLSKGDHQTHDHAQEQQTHERPPVGRKRHRSQDPHGPLPRGESQDRRPKVGDPHPGRAINHREPEDQAVRQRTNRMYEFVSLAEVEETIEELRTRDTLALVTQLQRQPGTKEARYAHLLMGPIDEAEIATSAAPVKRSGLEQRVTELEEKIAQLEAQFEQFKSQF